MTEVQTRKIIDLEWPTRYLLECGHAIAIAADASAAEMQMPGQMIACPTCGGAAAEPKTVLARFRAGEAINAMTMNDRLAAIEALLAGHGLLTPLTRFAADEPINATSLNARLDLIERALTFVK